MRRAAKQLKIWIKKGKFKISPGVAERAGVAGWEVAMGIFVKSSSIVIVLTFWACGAHSGHQSPVVAGDTNVARGAASNQTPRAPSADERAATPLSLTAPTLDTTLDPRTYKATKPYAPGAGIMLDELEAGRIMVPRDGREFTLPPCEHPLPFSSKATLSPSIDGDLSDWNGKGLVAIDRAGDGFSVDGVNYDLREFYFAGDATHYYIGVTLVDPWPKDTGAVRLHVDFGAVTVPTDKSANVSVKRQLQFDLFGTTLRQVQGTKYVTPQPAGDFLVAAKANTIEISLPKAQVDQALGTAQFYVQLWLWNGDSAQSRMETMAPNLVGFTDDYACLVTMPDQTVKLMPMRRLDMVAAGTAEVFYRALAAAAPTVEYVLNESHKLWDTVGAVVIDKETNPGLYVDPAAIFFTQEQSGVFGGGEVSVFAVAAHEYAHTINSGDYQLPRRWMAEGHSDWAARMALASYYGKYAGFEQFGADLDGFRGEEASKGGVSIDTDSWTSGVYPEYYYYNKSSTFYELMATILPYESMRTILKKPSSSGSAYKTSAEVLTAFAADPAFKATPGATPWQGWFDGGDYQASVLPTATLLKDDDFDRLYAFQESQLGTMDTQPDSTGTGVADPVAMTLTSAAKPSVKTQHLVLDQSLDDWALLVPGELQPPQTQGQVAASSSCQPYTTISRLGVVYDGDWLFIGVELGDAPGKRPGSVAAFLTEPSGRKSSVQLDFGDDRIVGWGPDHTVTHELHILSGGQGKTLELAFHRNWFGWGRTYPVGTTLQVVSYIGAGKNAVQCTATQSREPTFLN